ncbi:MAG: metallophosphoesterase family protein [Rhodocyclaceae bacterium]|uniref:YfcE family phosphodiesterase n=1 Tax=Desulfobacca acetoxidans TaxID=60893 RepID=A0A7V4LE31_9BACT|nr:metallophosphoesterase family protein [Rhodocyclaceae bacterium]
MVIGVVSDTHGNGAGLRALATRLYEQGVRVLLHLGDDYRDQDAAAGTGLQVVGVPGVYCPEYRDPAIPNRRVLALGELKFLLTHTESRHKHDSPGDLDPELTSYEVHAVLFGHTHAPTLEDRQGTAWINPGHLRDRQDRGHPPTYALLHLRPRELRAEIRAAEDDRLISAKIFRFQD